MRADLVSAPHPGSTKPRALITGVFPIWEYSRFRGSLSHPTANTIDLYSSRDVDETPTVRQFALATVHDESKPIRTTIHALLGVDMLNEF